MKPITLEIIITCGERTKVNAGNVELAEIVRRKIYHALMEISTGPIPSVTATVLPAK